VSLGMCREIFTYVVPFKKKKSWTPKLINSFRGTMSMMENEALTSFAFVTGNINMKDVLQTRNKTKKNPLTPLSYSCLKSCLVTNKNLSYLTHANSPVGKCQVV